MYFIKIGKVFEIAVVQYEKGLNVKYVTVAFS